MLAYPQRMSDSHAGDRRATFDFEISFLNGGGLKGEGFRLDIPGEDATERELADALVRDLRLLMVRDVRILNKRIIFERHKRAAVPEAGAPEASAGRFIDLSHAIGDGMVTYPGIPAPHICDYLSREASRSRYAPGVTFQIGRIDLVANTGTYLDSPFHRFADGHDIAQLCIEQLANLDAVLVRVTGSASRAIDAAAFGALEVRGKAVLVHSGWARHFGTDSYGHGHPFLTAAAAAALKERGALLVGIDSLNIDDTDDGARPVHTTLLGAGIPIVEHLRGLEQLPAEGFAFSAVPPAVRGMGSFPVRAYARL
jgi:arylformamidase